MKKSVEKSKIDDFMLSLPCLQEEHFPFKLAYSEGEGGVVMYGAVRISSRHGWDGCGGRTDLHDMLGLLWAASLRITGAASSSLWIDVGWVGKPEISSRLLFFAQPFGTTLSKSEFQSHFERLRAHTAWAAHCLTNLFCLQDAAEVPPVWVDKKPVWLSRLSTIFKNLDNGLWVIRKNPDWEYYTDRSNKISIVRLNEGSKKVIDMFLSFYRPSYTEVQNRHAIVSGAIRNCVNDSTVRRAVGILQKIEQHQCLKWKGLGDVADKDAIVAVPLESHCLFFGSRTIVALAHQCGVNEFLETQRLWKQKSIEEASIFNADLNWVWSKKIDPALFEALIEALLTEEPGLSWVRSTGPTYERDQGRDLVAIWLTPPGLGENAAEHPIDNSVRARRIIIQCKAYTRNIRKKDVQDVRDTLERHNAEGFLLVAFPGWTNDLFNYLESLSKKGVWINVWGQNHIEEKLRLHPHIADRFSQCAPVAIKRSVSISASTLASRPKLSRSFRKRATS